MILLLIAGDLLSKLNELKVDIGCGSKCKQGFLGIDCAKYTNDVKYVVDLDKNKLPFKSNSVDEAYSCHVLEHLDKPMEMVREVYRVLKPGAKFTIRVPYFANSAAYKPNHKNFWNLGCIDYFDGSYHEYPGWSKVKFDHVWAESNTYWLPKKFCDFIIKRKPLGYERRFSRLFPFFEIRIELEK